MSSYLAYLGIDPGAQGSLCLLAPSLGRIIFHDTPNGNNGVTCRDTFAWILAVHAQYSIRMIGLEQVHSVPGTSAGTNFKFGFNVGQIQAIAECTGIGVDLIQPKEWQKLVGVSSPGKALKNAPGNSKALKKAIASVSIRLYPQAQVLGPKGGLLDGRADALMIAHAMSIKY